MASSRWWCGVLVLLGTGTAPAIEPWAEALPRYDVRLPADAAAGFVLRAPTADQLVEADLLRALVPDLVLRWDGMSGSVRRLAAPAGRALSPPGAAAPAAAARAYLGAHARLLGLAAPDLADLEVARVVPLREGGAHVHFVQRARGLRVFRGAALVSVGPDGAILSLSAHLYAGMGHLAAAPVVSAGDALLIAQRDVYPLVPFSGRLVSAETTGERRTVGDGTGFASGPEARLVLFPLREGGRPAWEVRIAEPTLATDYAVLVDALDGAVLFRENRTSYAAARVLDAPAQDPKTEEKAPAQHVLLPVPTSTAESPVGWLSGAGTALAGNNATSHVGIASGPGLAEPGAVYDYRFNTLESALTNAWWWVNDTHDRLRALGFDEAAGNYQEDNFGLGGLGGDPVKVTQYTWRGVGGAYFSTRPDGESGMATFLWFPCASCGDHDGYPENGGERAAGFMRDVIVHECTHGMTNRIVGTTLDCLGSVQSGAMSEGWSDLFAATLTDDPRIGGHAYDSPTWLRDARQDLTYSDLCKVHDSGGCQGHADAMIWFATLWELRRSMIALDPSGGRERFERIAVRGVANTPCYPDFLDGRDALLEADTALYGSAHHAIIWNVFAHRRMGQGASSTGEADAAPVTSTTVPAGMTCTPPGAPAGLTAAAEGTNAIRLSFGAAGAAAVEVYREEVDNTFDTRVRIGSTTSTSTYLDTAVQGGVAYRYHVAVMGGAGLTCKGADSATADATADGPCVAVPVLDPDLRVSDGDPGCALTLAWQPARQGCPATPSGIVYNVYRAPSPGFEPSEPLLLARTTAETLQDEPPQDGQTYYYLVTAQHGTLADPPDHRLHGSAQVLQWVGRVPALGRATVQDWDFDGGPAGWTVDNAPDPNGAWTLADATPPTRYGDMPLAPNVVAGGSGMSWFTGQGNASAASNDCDGQNRLISPVFDGTGGRTLFSFDYWSTAGGLSTGGILLRVSNGTTTVEVQPVRARTLQPFDTASPRGWQRAEVDLAGIVAPTTSMQVTLLPRPDNLLSEYAIDNVKLEQATVCGRSALEVASIAADDAPPGWGNGNGVLEAGETARLLVTLVNQGGVASLAPLGTLTSRTPGLLLHEPQATFPDIAAGGGSGASLGGFTFTVPAAFGCGDTVTFDLAIVDAAGTVARRTAVLEGGRTESSVVFADTFATDKGWTSSGYLGKGKWQRADPVGTLDGANQANPETDSPNDAGALCYVTENGPRGAAAAANDVDSPGGIDPWLTSPTFDLSPYKRAEVSYDLWYYDSSGARSGEDYGAVEVYVNDGQVYSRQRTYQWDRTPGWTPAGGPVDQALVADSRLQVFARDADASVCGGCVDDIVEMGFDNVKITGSRPVCDAPGVTRAPGAVRTLALARGDRVALQWSPPAPDAGHDPAAYYELWTASDPAGPFALDGTSTGTSGTDDLAPVTVFYSIAAVNAAGTSGFAPTP